MDGHLLLKVKQESCKHKFKVFNLTRYEIEPESTDLVADTVSNLLTRKHQYN